ncbi:unnamed protein product [Didymodactylos carnosus]|uniref:Cytochrome P450 n=1 Tax=Didymodactylos carnosus TaxID=1234261 RepID=A0A814L598_9BILA|nr:unnamed protein product [Didymodactylos carnosus]CAF1060363.1 unnamed protein product [Didymodactylos carnosus]CAF3590484.1 unnamed protein product [Didymodactylos carnosus]CAF3828753.1 unnamed protein product [Didymodactylos carnosus]
MALTLILLSILICLCLTYILRIFTRYQYFKQRNIPTPPYEFFYGHLRAIWNVQSRSKLMQEWTRIYGKIYGIFEGTTPVYVVSDVDFLQDVFIKQFSNFYARRPTVAFNLSSSPNASVLDANGLKWKRQRSVINPTFSSLKLKQMSPLINDCVDQIMSKLAEHYESKQEFNIYVLYKRLTMDVICRCAFGVDTNMQNDPENVYLKQSDKLFAIDLGAHPITKLRQLIPEFNTLFANLFVIYNYCQGMINKFIPWSVKMFQQMPIFWLLNRIHELVELRLKNTNARVDLLQLMLEAATRQQITV